jgi:hypothetical protein
MFAFRLIIYLLVVVFNLISVIFLVADYPERGIKKNRGIVLFFIAILLDILSYYL